MTLVPLRPLSARDLPSHRPAGPALGRRLLAGLLLVAAATACDDDGEGPTEVENLPPTVTGATVSVNKNESATVELVGADPDGDALTFRIVEDPENGELVVEELGGGRLRATYTPDPDFAGSDGFVVEVSDGTDTATGAVSIEVVDRAPAGEAPSVVTRPASGGGVEVELSGTDPDGDPLTFVVTTPPADGTLGEFVIVSGPGAARSRGTASSVPATTVAVVTYTPDAGFSGDDAFGFAVSDGRSTSAEVLVTVEVNGVPEAAPVMVTTLQDEPVVVELAGVDPDGDPLVFEVVQSPSHGDLSTVTPTGGGGALVTYTPDSGFGGDDAFTYRVLDPLDASPPAEVSIFVEGGLPTADDVAVTTDEDQAVTLTLTGADPQGDPLTFEVLDSPRYGTLSEVTSTGATTAAITYTPRPDFDGRDRFHFRVSDGASASETARADITVTPVNDAPVMSPVAPQTGASGQIFTFALEAEDPDGDDLTFDVVGAPAAGSVLSVTSTGPETAELVYQAPAAGGGTITFEVVAEDAELASDPVTVTVILDGAPTADPQTVSTDEDVPVALTLTGSDPEGTDLTFTIVSGPSNGALGALVPGGSPVDQVGVTYTPAVDFSGADAFTFQVEDGFGLTATATVTITVVSVNDVPSFTPGPDQTVVEDNPPVTVASWATAISAGSGETFNVGDGAGFTVTGNTNPALFAAGPAVDLNSGDLTFTPATDANGSADVTLELADGDGLVSPPHTLTITVLPVNDAPSFTKGADVVVDEDAGPQTVDPWATAISPGPADEAAQTLTFTVTNDDNALFAGQPAVSSTGVLTFESAPDAFGSATVTVSAMDDGGTANGGSNTSPPQTFSIVVNAVNDAPKLKAGATLDFETAGNTTFQLAGTQTVTPSVFENSDLTSTIVARFEDPEGDPIELSPTPTNVAAGASVTLNADGTFTYTPTAGATGSQTFDLTIQDDPAAGTPESATETVTITLTDMVWYVDRTAAGGGTGTSAAPLQTPGAAATAGSAGDRIFVYEAGSGGTPYDGGVTLKADQQLLGEPEGLSVTLVGAGATQLVAPGATRPTLRNTGGDAITLASGSVVRSFIVSGASDDALSGNAIAGSTVSDLEITGATDMGVDLVAPSGTVAFTDLDVGGTTGTAVNVDGGSATITFGIAPATLTNASGRTVSVANTTGGSVTFSGGPITQTAGTGLHFTNNAAAISVQQAVTVQASTDTGVRVDGSSGTVGFADLAITSSGGTGASFTNNTGTVTVTTGTVATSGQTALEVNASPLVSTFTSVTKTGANTGVTITSSTGTKTFGTLSVTSTSGTAFLASGAGTVNVTNPASTLAATAGVGLDLQNTAVSATLASVTSGSSPGDGINLDGVTGTLTINGGSISGAAGVAFDENATSATVSYPGSITNTAGRSVEVTGRSGGSLTLSGTLNDTGTGVNIANNTGGTITLGGGTKTVNTGTNAAVTLSGNTGATVAFTGGGLDIDATSGKGFTATGGGTVTVEGANNTAATTTGTALEIQNTTIGGNGVTFLSVGSNGGADPGIIAVNTGASGGLTVTGDGGGTSNGSGGTIQNKTGNGVTLTSTRRPSLNYMNIDANGDNGIVGTSLNGFVLTRSNLRDNANAVSPDEAGLHLVDLSGGALGSATETRIADVLVEDSWENNVILRSSSGTVANLSVTGSTFRNDGGSGVAASQFLVDASGTAAITMNASSSTFDGNTVAGALTAFGFVADAAGTSDIVANVSGSTFTDNNVALSASASAGGDVTFAFTNNATITGSRSNAINVFANASHTGNLIGTISGNTVGTLNTTASGSDTGSGIRASNEGGGLMRLLIDNNTVQEMANFEGILVSQAVSAGTTEATITNNTVRETDFDRGLVAQITSAGTMCTDIRGNAFSAIGGTTDLRVRQTAGVHNNEQKAPTAAADAAELDDANGGATVTVTGAINFEAANCGTP